MMKRFALLLPVCISAGPLAAQCPAVGTLTAAAATTTANCPSSGTATISTNAPAGQPLIYTIIAGPAGAPLNNPQNNNVFNALLAGAYTVKAECTNGAEDTVSFTITNGYAPISAVSTSVTTNCGTFSKGGTIDIANVTGGSLPLQYSFIKNTDANYPDNLSVYGSAATKSVTSYGTYQVRVKDACNQIYTRTVVLEPALPPVQIGYWQLLNNQPCSSNNIDLFYTLYDTASGNPKDQADYIAAGGIKVIAYERAAGSCAPSGPALLNGQIVTQNNFLLPEVPSNRYYIQTITPCGDTTASCLDLSADLVPDMWIYTKSAGCTGSSTNPPTQSIRQVSQRYLNYPVSITVRNDANAVVYTQTLTTAADVFSVTGLPVGNYTVEILDECGVSLLRNSWNPTAAPSLSMLVNSEGLGSCWGSSSQTQSGTKQMSVNFDGYIDDFEHAVVTILSGPGNVGQQGVNAPAGSGIFGWSNLLPGNYVIKVVTACDSLTFSTTIDTAGLLVQQVSAAAVSNCGGSGTVTATSLYNGAYALTYVLKDAGSMTTLDSNSTGVFANLPAGNYLVSMKLNNYCNGTFYYINSNTVAITSAVSGPQIVKKIGLVCEDPVTGMSTGAGNVYLELSGGTPRTLEYKLTSAATWELYSSNAPATVTISGLAPGSIYDVRVTSCGVSAATQVAIEAMQPLQTTTAAHPCDGSPYSLDAPEIAGAVYEWRNPSGTVVATTYNYQIASYNSSYDGQYTCKVSFGNCVTRNIAVQITSTACNTPLPVILKSFAAKEEGCTVRLDWEINDAVDFSRFELQYSPDGRGFSTIATLPYTAGLTQYHYTDQHPAAGRNHYRLKLTDLDGSTAVSMTATAANSCATGGIQIYPNPATDRIYIRTSRVAQVLLTDLSGRIVPVAATGSNNIALDITGLANGVYLLTVKSGTEYRTEKILVQH